MFLKRQKRHKGGEDYSYWELARTVRTAAGPRHETVAYLGKRTDVTEVEKPTMPKPRDKPLVDPAEL